MIIADVSRAKRGEGAQSRRPAGQRSADRRDRRAGRMIGAYASKTSCFARETDHRTVGQGRGNAFPAFCGKREGL